MPVESWITPEEAPALAAAAIAEIDAALSGLSEAQRDAFWNSVRKCYNTPYNDPPPRKRTFAVSAVNVPPAPCASGLSVAVLPAFQPQHEFRPVVELPSSNMMTSATFFCWFCHTGEAWIFFTSLST